MRPPVVPSAEDPLAWSELSSQAIPGQKLSPEKGSGDLKGLSVGFSTMSESAAMLLSENTPGLWMGSI
jgi:hypothetical protein